MRITFTNGKSLEVTRVWFSIPFVRFFVKGEKRYTEEYVRNVKSISILPYQPKRKKK